MTAKFRQIIEQLNALITLKVDKSMSDEDFIANIDAINLLCNLHDDLKLDRSEIRKKLSRLYPEFSRRIYGKKNIQFAMPLIKALNNFIYGRAEDYGPVRWRNDLTEMCCKVVDSYRENSLIGSTDYLFALDVICCTNDDSDNDNIREYKKIISSCLEDIDTVPLSEKVKRVSAYGRSKHLFISENWEKWAEIRGALKDIDLSQLDDETFIIWREVTDLTPMKELKKRAGHSNQMQVEYLQALIFTEFERQDRLAANRKLSNGLKTLNDDIIGDLIPLKIDATMSVSTLYALEIIFYLRLQLAQVSWAENEPIYESLCRKRFEEIAKALTKKYKTAETLNEKIEILERLSSIGMTIHSSHLDFAIEEADKLKELSNLTYAQKLRLDWIPTINSENESQIVAKLLPRANSTFDMATLALIIDYITDTERNAILNRYFDLFDTALLANNTTELGSLLSLAAYWNSDPAIRPRLTDAANKAASIEALSLPEKRVNIIAAEIYSQIDQITGKYEDIPA